MAPPGTKLFGGGKPQVGKGAQVSGDQLVNLNQLENLLKDVKTGVRGVIQKGKAIATGGDVEAPAKVYNDFADAIAVGLYRNVTGDVRISDADVGRARKILPFAYDSSEVRKTKLDFIRTALEAKAKPNPSANPATGGSMSPAAAQDFDFFKNEAQTPISVGDLFQGHKVLSVKKVK